MKHLKKYNENMYDQQMRDEQENDPNWGKPKDGKVIDINSKIDLEKIWK